MAFSMPVPGFLFGGNTGETPESLARQRAVADALAQANGRAPANVGEGIAAIGRALAYRGITGRADRAQAAGQASALDDFKALFPDIAGGSAGAPAPAAPMTIQSASASGMPQVKPPSPAGGSDTLGFISQHEGFTPTPYWDNGQWSVGYGTRATPQEVASKQPISQDIGQQRLADEVAKASSYVDSVIKVPLTANQKSALTSLAYNVGSFGPGLISAVNSGDYAAVPSHISAYGVSDPKYANGIANRRRDEVALWNGGGGAPVQVASLGNDPGILMNPPSGTANSDPRMTLNPPPGMQNTDPGILMAPGAAAMPSQPQPAPGVASVAGALTGPATATATGVLPKPAAGPQVAQSSGPSLQALFGVLSNPWASEGQKAVANALLQRQMQQQDPAAQLKLKTDQLQYEKLQHPTPERQVIGNTAYERQPDGTWKPVITGAPAAGQPTASIQEYQFYAAQEQAAGRVPKSFTDYQNTPKAEAPFTLAPGDLRFGAQGGSPIATNPRAPAAPYTDVGKINSDLKAGNITPEQASTEAAKLTGGGRPFTDAERKSFGITAGQAGYMDTQGVPHVLGGANISIDLGSGGGSVPLTAAGTPDPQAQSAFLANLSPGTAAAVKGFANYELDPTKDTSMRGDQRLQMIQLTKLYDPTYDQSQFPARAAMRKSITSGPYSQTINAANLVIQHLDALHEAIAGLENGDYPLVNAGKNFAKQQMGDPVINRFNTAADAAASELAKVFKGTGVSDVESIKSWRANLDINGSPKQIQQTIDTAIGDLLASRLDTVRTQYEAVMGKPYDFTFLTPHSKEVLTTLGIDVSRLDPNSTNASPNLSGGSGGSSVIDDLIKKYAP